MADCLSATENVQDVIVCAAQTYGAQIMRDEPTRLVLPNLQIHSNLLEASRLSGVERVLLISSSTVYQEAFRPLREDELDLNVQPFPLYQGVGWMKRYVEQLARFYFDRYRLPIAIVRPSNIYGPRDKFADDREPRPAGADQARAARRAPVRRLGHRCCGARLPLRRGLRRRPARRAGARPAVHLRSAEPGERQRAHDRRRGADHPRGLRPRCASPSTIRRSPTRSRTACSTRPRRTRSSAAARVPPFAPASPRPSPGTAASARSIVQLDAAARRRHERVAGPARRHRAALRRRPRGGARRLSCATASTSSRTCFAQTSATRCGRRPPRSVRTAAAPCAPVMNPHLLHAAFLRALCHPGDRRHPGAPGRRSGERAAEPATFRASPARRASPRTRTTTTSRPSATPSPRPGSRSTTSSAANGALIAYPGSHASRCCRSARSRTRGRTRRRRSTRSASRCSCPPATARTPSRCARGAVVFLHGHLLHGSHANRAARPRRALLATYLRRGAAFRRGAQRAAQRDRRLRPVEDAMSSAPATTWATTRTSPPRRPGARCAPTPLGFVDVGARGGVHPLVEPLARRTAVLGFEPAARRVRAAARRARLGLAVGALRDRAAGARRTAGPGRAARALGAPPTARCGRPTRRSPSATGWSSGASSRASRSR